jgi:hypothetical protein
MTRTLVIAALFGLVGWAPAAAQPKPNFTGDWKMNAAASNFGGMPVPTSLTQKVAHEEPTMKIASAQSGEFGDWNTDFTFTTDGKECVNSAGEFQLKSTLEWEGPVLVVDSKMDFQGNAATFTDRWTLSEDGKTLTVTRQFSGPMGAGEGKIIFDRQ